MILLGLFGHSQIKAQEWRSPSRPDTLGLKKYLIKEYGKTSPELESATYLYTPITNSFFRGFLGGLGREPSGKLDSDYEKMVKILASSSLYLTSLPQLDKNPNDLVPFDNFGTNSLMPIWDKGMKALPQFKDNLDYLSNLNGFTSLVLNAYLGRVYRKCHHSYTEKEKRSFRKNSRDFENILKDLNILISFDSQSKPLSPKDRLELFRERDSSGRNGLEFKEDALNYPGSITTLYLPRWNLYRDYIQDCLDNHKKPDTHYINQKMTDLEYAWAINPKNVLKSGSISRKEWAKTLQSLYYKYQGINFRIE